MTLTKPGRLTSYPHCLFLITSCEKNSQIEFSEHTMKRNHLTSDFLLQQENGTPHASLLPTSLEEQLK